jgi:propionyl-CoA carboxylase alpha chain
MFSKILIANRGEIAVRVIKTCRRMGIKTVVRSTPRPTPTAWPWRWPTRPCSSVRPPPQSPIWCRQDHRRLQADRRPGRASGLRLPVSENAGFAQRCADEGIVFIGPNPGAIRAMGDKIESKKFAAEGRRQLRARPHRRDRRHRPRRQDLRGDRLSGDDQGQRRRRRQGHPRRPQPRRTSRKASRLSVKAEAKSSFGDDRIFIEKFITSPRHIEIQVMGDKHGNVVHLFERECSIQRRNQKVIEEAPSPLLDEATRAAMGAQAVALAKAVNYDSAGTVEFVAGQDKSFYFLEMNTRLQVEHPVTELITGLDLVEQMIRSAWGETLAFEPEGPEDQRLGHREPHLRRGPLSQVPARASAAWSATSRRSRASMGDYVVRNDAGVREGDEISMFYDPMIAKLCSLGADAPPPSTAWAGRWRTSTSRAGPQHPLPRRRDGPGAVPLGQSVDQLHRRRVPRRLPRHDCRTAARPTPDRRRRRHAPRSSRNGPAVGPPDWVLSPSATTAAASTVSPSPMTTARS